MDNKQNKLYFDGLRRPGFAHQSYDDDNRGELLAHMGMEQMIHDNLSQEVSKCIVAMVAMAQDMAKWDQKSADLVYDGIVKLAEAQERFEADEVKTAIVKRDMERKNAFGDYFRRKDKPISRY